jgi:hypothetical protein
VLGFESPAGAPAIEFLRVSWVGDGTVLVDERRIPETGALDPGPRLGSFEIDVRHPDSWRTVVAHGFIATGLVAEGAVRVFVPARQTTSATVRLLAGRLADADRDGIPDLVDNCPGEPNRAQQACAADAAAPDAGGPLDAGDAPVAPQRLDAESPPADLPRADETRPADGPVDTRTAADGKVPRGRPCTADDECDTGHCGEGIAGRFCTSVDMVAVPAGSFTRGCDPGQDPDCSRDEQPAQAVTLVGFEIDRTEVTRAALDLCVRAGRCVAPAGFDPGTRPGHPAANVPFALADTYCRWAGKRLPTEAEWEKAARGPLDARRYPWGDEPATCARAQYDSCGLLDPVPVAVLGGTSVYGAEDLAGNVAEWVSDFYLADYYGTAPASDPRGPVTGTARVKRGGGFKARATLLRVSARASGERDLADQGFRCARDL